MCEICRSTPHLKSCPLALPPKTAFYCSGCGSPVKEGEEGYQLGEERYCEECVRKSRFTAEVSSDEI